MALATSKTVHGQQSSLQKYAGFQNISDIDAAD
jgi:hypothetical protein